MRVRLEHVRMRLAGERLPRRLKRSWLAPFESVDLGAVLSRDSSCAPRASARKDFGAHCLPLAVAFVPPARPGCPVVVCAMRWLPVVALLVAVLLLAPASATATTVTAQIEGEVVAGVAVKGTLVVTGAPAGAGIWIILHRGAGACPGPSMLDVYDAVASAADFTLPFSVAHTDDDSLDFDYTGPWLLCVTIATTDAYRRAVGVFATAVVALTARAPRGELTVTAARWNARLHRLTFSLRGDSETRGSVERFLLPRRVACPPKSPRVLFQTPADLGDLGPPADAAGRFSYTRSVTWRREIPPAGRYRVCAYLISEVATSTARGSLIQMARASRLVHVSR
jgi:hypothetical protein